MVCMGRASDLGEQSFVLVRLDAKGHQRGDGTELTVAGEVRDLALVAAPGDEERILAVVTTRTEEVFGDRDVVLYHDRARLLDLGTPLKCGISELGPLHADVASVQAASLGRQTTWTMGTVRWVPEASMGVENAVVSLEYGYGVGPSLPVLRRTDIGGAIRAHAVAEQGIVALAGTSKLLELWALPASGPPKCLGEVARARTRTSFSDASILRLADGFALIWYVCASASAGPVGGLWARTCSVSCDALSPPVRLARDDDALWGEWGAHGLGNTGLVLFGSGAKGDPVRELHLRERRDIDSVPRRFVPGPLPRAVIATSEGAVVITNQDTRGTSRVTARLIAL